MTIAEFAADKAVSPQAVYSRLKKAGITLSSILDKDKKLTEDGLARISMLYDEEHKQEQIKADTRIAELTEKLLEAQKEITELQAQLASMTTQAVEANKNQLKLE